MDDDIDDTGKKSNTPLVIGTVVLAVVVLLVMGFALIRKPSMVSPLPEEEGDVRVIFVSPEPSATVSASIEASPSGTPKSTVKPRTSPATSPKATPKTSPSGTASPSATPKS